jgi:two-component system, chemotaxis family, protein-glutamate methylesterase/glutaminase
VNQKPIRVLVVDDSAYMRKSIRTMLESSPPIKVVGAAFSVADALEKAQELQPDVVTVDLVMDEPGGVGFIREQMRRRPVPMVVFSSASLAGIEVIEAMEAGAIDFVRKPTAQALEQIMDIRTELVSAVMTAAHVPAEKILPLEAVIEDFAALLPRPSNGAFRVLLIGISTGGPRGLRRLLPRFPADFPVPVAIVLHMPPGFTSAMAKKLDEICPLEVIESSEGLEMLPGRIILAKAGMHTRLETGSSGQVITRLYEPGSDSPYCPSVDILFESGAQVYGSRVLGVVMTGMGDDGKAGAAWIKAAGGQVFAEAESSSIVYGMPRSVVEAGLADRIVPLDQLADAILEVMV